MRSATGASCDGGLGCPVLHAKDKFESCVVVSSNVSGLDDSEPLVLVDSKRTCELSGFDVGNPWILGSGKSFGIEGPAGNEDFLKTYQVVSETVGEKVFDHPSLVQSEVGVKQKRVLRTIKKSEKLVMMTIGEDVG